MYKLFIGFGIVYNVRRNEVRLCDTRVYVEIEGVFFF